jgi:MFS family permease
MRGRVLSAVSVVGSLSGMVGAPTLGWLSERLGARTALVFAGAGCLLACAGAAALLARLTADTALATTPPTRRRGRPHAPRAA